MLTEKIRQVDEETKGEITEAIKNQRFKPLIKNGVWIGFFIWLEEYRDNQRFIFINRLWIEPKYRSKENLLFLRNFFRKLYNREYRFVFWRSKKNNRFFYAR